MSRANTFAASAADRERVHSVRMVEGEKRTITLDLTSVIPADDTVSGVTWSLQGGGIVDTSDASTDASSASVRLTAVGAWGSDVLTATIALTGGDVLLERFVVGVTGIL